MSERQFGKSVTISAGTSMGDLTRSRDYSYISSALFEQGDLNHRMDFIPRLVNAETQLHRPGALAWLNQAGENYWRPAGLWHHLGFCLKYPDVQDARYADPIISIGDTLKVNGFARVLSTYWEPYSGRKLYLNFEDALIGSRVWFLVVHDFSNA